MKLLHEINHKVKLVTKKLTDLDEGLEKNKYKSTEEIISLASKTQELMSDIQKKIVDCSSQVEYCFRDLNRRFSTVEQILIRLRLDAKKSKNISKYKGEITFSAGAALGIWEDKCLDKYEAWLLSFLEETLDSAIHTKNFQLSIDLVNCAKTLDSYPEELSEKFDEFTKICPPVLLLKHYRRELSTHKLASLIGEKLSPTISYLRQLPEGYYEKSVQLTHSETYVRSEKHPKVRELRKGRKPVLILYSDKVLEKGALANVGSYGNLMQMLGDTCVPTPIGIPTSVGDASLYHAMLKYKNNICSDISLKMGLHNPKSLIKVGHHNAYPCVMVWINPKSICRSVQTPYPSSDAKEDWVEFLISHFVGLINFNAYKMGIPIEMQRRSGFGFITPTIARTGGSFRINIGIIPQKYANIVVESLQQFDAMLQALPKQQFPMPVNIFYGSKEHVEYLKGKAEDTEVSDVQKENQKDLNEQKIKQKKKKKIYTAVPLGSALHLLWAKIEKGGKTTVQNIVRSAYARDGISIEILKSLQNNKTPIEAFSNGLLWVIKKIKIKNHGKKLSVGVCEEKRVTCDIKFFKQNYIIQDQVFWAMIHDIIEHFSKLNIPRLQSILRQLRQSCQSRILNQVHLDLDTLNQLLFVSAIKQAKPKEQGDGYGSDSDTEAEVTVSAKRSQPVSAKPVNAKQRTEKDKIAGNKGIDEVIKVKIFSKKINTHNGMRAILGTILTISHYLKEAGVKDNTSCRLFLDNTYYEVPVGLKIISQLHRNSSIMQVKNLSEANSILYDLNACVTGGQPNVALNHATIAGKILILDATSATSEQIKPYLLNFAQSRASMLFVVDSGFKNQQAGADLLQIGTIRIFTKDKKILEKLYVKIKTIEPPILSPTALTFKRLLKAVGAVPVTRNFFKA